MHLLLVLEIIAQIYFVVHAIKTDKARYWIYIIILVPWIGFLIYFAAEFLPEYQASQSAKVTTTNEKESGSLTDDKRRRGRIKLDINWPISRRESSFIKMIPHQQIRFIAILVSK